MARRISGRNAAGGKPGSHPDEVRGHGDYRPSREEILRFIAENPDRAGKREIARSFGLKSGDRVWLKDMLRDLQDEGMLTKSRKRLARVGALPHVAVLDIFGRDGEGLLLARQAEQADSNGPGPTVQIRLSRSGPTAGVGDRVLAKTFPIEGSADPAMPAYTARIMKVFEKRKDAVLGIFRVLRARAGRAAPAGAYDRQGWPERREER